MHIEFRELGRNGPIRAELFSTERLEKHAKSLAAAQPVGVGSGGVTPLVRALKANARQLVRNFIALARAANHGKSITSAGEWFLDNFHVVEEQVREVRKDLPPSFYRELPKLADGYLRGYPRVYGLAWAMVAHTDSGFDVERLERFVHAYQTVAPLTIGELWAIAITLRLTLVENLTRLTQAVTARVNESERAENLANQLLGLLGRGETEAARALLADLHVTPALLARLEQRLRDNDGAETLLLHIEQELAARGSTVEAIVHEEYQARAADDISVRNIITAMRLISSTDWADFFEEVSLTDAALRRHDLYAAMDFATRNRYRHAVEKLALRAPLSETQIAEAAVREADVAAKAGARIPARDPGFYLIGHGRRDFEATIRYRPSPREKLLRGIGATGVAGYLGTIALMTTAMAGLITAAEAGFGLRDDVLAVLIVLALLPASELAVALVNRAVTNRWQPKVLPSLSLKDGVPEQFRTLLAVPVLLTQRTAIETQIDDLEVLYLSNTEAGMQFALLSDWGDSEQEHCADDQALLDFARERTAILNQRHAPGAPPLFLLLHRKRLWNPAQGKWMGWERKRGKLHELNRLLRGATDTGFIGVETERINPGVRYVITLDADTRMPRGAARRLIGKMAHPLNLPEFDAAGGRVIAGHGILQPRVTPSLPINSESSLFQWAFSGPNGLDPYAFAVSDVYQDLFEEGSFVGKGIYDVDAFERALNSSIAENSVLSHDLLEGVLARAALVSDIEFVEEFPSRYDVEAARQHRWVRGDWQLLPWIFNPRTRLSLLGRWKMLDNLRRSLVAPSMLLAFLIGWTLPWDAALIWSSFLGLVIILPPALPILAGIVPRQTGYSRRGHLRSLARDAVLAVTQTLFTFSFLARFTLLALDAIARTLFRLFVSRRNLLEWISFAQAARADRLSGRNLAKELSISLVFVASVIGLLTLAQPGNLALALPFLTLWGFSPVLARWASHAPLVEPHLKMSDSDRAALRLAARRTWSFFERFVTAEDNMLPPDNYQEDPVPLLAHRTSPTNIGVYLNTVLAARDFGWIGTLETVERLETTLATLERLERFQGHFMNWYDTTTLLSLEPRYISSVDSGNLAGNLLVLKNACAQIMARPANEAAHAGLEDGLALLRPALGKNAAALQSLEHRLKAKDQEWTAIAAEAEALASGMANSGAASALLASARSHARDAGLDAATLSPRLAKIAATAGAMAEAMDFAFLFDEDRQLLTIGYRPDQQMRDDNAYDLLASEARLASFFAIAKGDVPTRHWFHLGRTLSPLGRIPALQSWSGSMFEYLMPSLIMHEPPGSLLNMSNRAAVRRQIHYTALRRIPWGISESQYNARDRQQNYQYSGFGVPELGIKRGLGENTVIAPYATGLAAMVNPRAARRNLDHLTRIGALGDYGWYEAIDYTRARLPDHRGHVVIKSYMAHHQGMMIMGLADVLNDGAMRERFHAEPMVKATELLLQERMPRDVSVARLPPARQTGAITYHDPAPRGPRLFGKPDAALPRTHLLANDEYAVMLTSAGTGYSRWRGMAINRWREDAVSDPWGAFLYLRDVRSGKVWSAGHQPRGQDSDSYEAAFSEDRAEFRRLDGQLATTLEICVSPEANAEVRRLTITNNGSRLREIEVTSYMELALARPADDDAHPAFSKLFVQTEYLRETNALLAHRRPRSPSEQPIWAAHLSVTDSGSVGDVQYETDRGKFIARNRSVRNPCAVLENWPLSNSGGAVLDPCFSLRRRVQIARGSSVTIDFWTLAAASREEIIGLVDRHHDRAAFDRASTLAATHAQSRLQYLGVNGEEAHLFQRLANHVLFAGAATRAPAALLNAAAPPASALWPLGISGDLPIVLIRMGDNEEMDFMRQMIRAHDYWRGKRLACDLVILNERASSYAQDLQKALDGIVHTYDRSQEDGTLGRVHLVRSDLAGGGAVAALRAVARIDLSGRKGSLEAQIQRFAESAAPPLALAPAAPAAAPQSADASGLQFFNGYGGFSEDGREYVVVSGRPTPAPWVNVIANPAFGFQVSAEGAGFCWATNAQQNQITPWSNDPVSNEPGDCLYLQDRDSGELWSATAAPIADPACRYRARHGQGYSVFETEGHGIASTLTQFVPLQDPLCIWRLKLRNDSARTRRVAITRYAVWALGPSRGAALFLQTERDPQTGSLFARNPVSADFSARIAFLDMGGKQMAWTADRAEFLGRGGHPSTPAALAAGAKLRGAAGIGLDPCGVLQTEVTLAPGAETEIILLLGQGRDRDQARALVEKYRAENLDAVQEGVAALWDDLLGTLTIRTPDAAMDVIVNRWLLYQTLSCRMWGRAGFYQASGAYGFRDQLQDCMALCAARPDLAREQILRAAGRQFAEGDVQHWWLPESGKGIRTRISDDKAWLGHVVDYYVTATGDAAILEEQLPFLTGALLTPEQHEAFFEPGTTTQTATLYEHCALALDASLAVGAHGLPLMGTGDWNDGMNRVGEGGKGESVWLGWFLHHALARFLPYAERRRDAPRLARWLVHMDALQEALEEHGWDGAWYRRAYFDDGFALGSSANRECRIDAIAQSWAVISGVAAPDRAARAMEAIDKYLVRPEDRLMTLFTPPFVASQHDPGYIKGYPAGVRENGGQYTHGVLWGIIAHTMRGDGDKAGELFEMINPVNHGRTQNRIERYRIEPYVAAGDVYSAAPHIGRGGWSWYTGSAAWMYRTAVERILGLRLEGDMLTIDPVIPASWPGFEAVLRHKGAVYRIAVDNRAGASRGLARLTLDGAALDAAKGIPLRTDGKVHDVLAIMGTRDIARSAVAE